MADEPTYEDLKARIGELNKIVAECKLTEEALRESEERYRTLYENVPVGVYRASLSGEILSANPAAVAIFGFDTEENLLSHDVNDLFKEPEKRETVLSQLNAEGKITNFEAEFKRKDGSLFWGSISASLVADKDGDFVFSDGIIQDITEAGSTE